MTASQALKAIFDKKPDADELAELINVIAQAYAKDFVVVLEAVENCRKSTSAEAFSNCVKTNITTKPKTLEKPENKAKP